MRMNKETTSSLQITKKVKSFFGALLRSGAILAVMFLYLFSFTQPTTTWTIVHSHEASEAQHEAAHEHDDGDDHHHHSHDEPSPTATAKQSEDSSAERTHSHSFVITSVPIHSVPPLTSMIHVDAAVSSFAISKEQQPPIDPNLGSIFRPPIAG